MLAGKAPPVAISNRALPDFVYTQPDNLQPQPSLTRFWCERCVCALSTQSKSLPDGSLDGFIEVMLDNTEYCARKGNYGVCQGCRSAKTGGCVEV